MWMPPGLLVDDERQRKVVDQLRMDPRSLGATDLLETPLEDLRTLMAAWLEDTGKPARAASAAPSRERRSSSICIYDKRDRDAIAPWADFLFKRVRGHPSRASTAMRPRSATITRTISAAATAR